MPTENPQDPQIKSEAQLQNEARLGEQFQQLLDDRRGPSIPPEKLVFEAGSNQSNYMRDLANLRAAQEAQIKTEQKILQIQRIQRRESDAYMRALQRTRRMKKDELKDELDHFNLLKNRKQEIKDIGDVERGVANAAQKRRVEDLKVAAAQARALEQEIGVDAGSQIQMGPNATPEDLIRAGRGGRGAQWASKGGIRGYLGRQYLETSGAYRGAAGATGFSVGALTAAARSMPAVSAALAAGYAIKGINAGQGLYIPGVGSIPLTDFQNQITSGQTTGEGYRAGLSAKFRGFVMSAMNPLDTITPQIAQSIIEAVRSQGFRGSLEREFENSIKDVYKDTGLPVEQIAAIGEIYARTGRLDEFKNAMENLDKIAKDTGQSVQNVAEQFQTLNEELVVKGGVANMGRPGAITAALGAIPGSSAQHQQYAAFMAQGASPYTGLTPTAASTRAGQAFFDKQIQTIIPALRQSITGLPKDQQDLLLGQIIDSGMLPGITDVEAARHFIMTGDKANKTIHGRAALARIDTAFEGATRNQYTRRGILLNRLSHSGTRIDENAMRMDERHVYIASLEHRLRMDGMSPQELHRVLSPLKMELSSPGQHAGSWHQAVQSAHGRAHSFARQNPNKGTITIKLDSAETRRLLSGKHVSKQIGIEDAYHGARSVVGTAFGDLWSG